MKLDWKFNSDNDRCFANVEEGQLIISKGFRGAWCLEWLFLNSPMRYMASDKFGHYAFSTAEFAMAEVEDWYHSTQARTADQCPKS